MVLNQVVICLNHSFLPPDVWSSSRDPVNSLSTVRLSSSWSLPEFRRKHRVCLASNDRISKCLPVVDGSRKKYPYRIANAKASVRLIGATVVDSTSAICGNTISAGSDVSTTQPG